MKCPKCGKDMTPLFHNDALMGWVCCECKTGVVFEA